MTLKKRLARELVAQLYSQKEASGAEAHFEKTVQNKEVPDEIEEYEITADTPVSKLLADAGLADSRSEAVRLIRQGAVSIGERKVSDANEAIPRGVVIKVGKRRYLKTK